MIGFLWTKEFEWEFVNKREPLKMFFSSRSPQSVSPVSQPQSVSPVSQSGTEIGLVIQMPLKNFSLDI